MSALYDDFAAAAIELLADLDIGQAITLERQNSSNTVDDNTGTVVKGTPETFPGHGVVFEYKQNLVDGTNVLQGDQLVYLAPDLGATPETGDVLILANGKRKQVVDSMPVAPAGQIVLHQVQARDL